MDEEVRPAVFGNVGTTIVFRVGPFDAEVLETVFFPEFTKEDLVNLGFAQIYLSLMIDGIGSRPFSAVTIPPIEPPKRSFKAEVIAASRERYGSPRTGIEGTIVAELAATADAAVEGEKMRASRSSSYAGGERGRTFRPREEPPVSRPAAPVPSVRAPERVHQQPVRKPFPSEATREYPQENVRTQPPPSSSRTATDLKAILKTVAEKAGRNKDNEHAARHGSLKDTLADVMKRSGVSVEKGAAALPQPPAASSEPRAPQSGKETKPYEVPEDTLRNILSGDDA